MSPDTSEQNSDHALIPANSVQQKHHAALQIARQLNRSVARNAKHALLPFNAPRWMLPTAALLSITGALIAGTAAALNARKRVRSTVKDTHSAIIDSTSALSKSTAPINTAPIMQQSGAAWIAIRQLMIVVRTPKIDVQIVSQAVVIVSKPTGKE